MTMSGCATNAARMRRKRWTIRSRGDAPEVDGVVRIRGGGKLPVGEFARVRITRAGDHDLAATPVNG